MRFWVKIQYVDPLQNGCHDLHDLTRVMVARFESVQGTYRQCDRALDRNLSYFKNCSFPCTSCSSTPVTGIRYR